MEPPYINFTSNYFSIGHGSDPGATGKNNEDNYAIFETMAQQGDDQATTRPVYVALVADGIGGAVSGELASRLAIQYFVEKFQQTQETPIPQRLEEAIHYTNRAIFATALEGFSNRGMGTTIVAAAICNDELYIAHAGDSRAYLLRRGQIYLLTLDHTWVQEAIDAGYLTPEQAERHPNKNVIKRYLGPLDQVEVDHTLIALDKRTGDVSLPEHRHLAPDNRIALQPGDTLLLCSDGLSDVVSDATILETILRYRPPKAVTELIRLANAAGGPDNITALILQHAGTPLTPRPVPATSEPTILNPTLSPMEQLPKRGGSLRSLLLAALLLVLAIGIGLLLPQLLSPRSASQPGNGTVPTPALTNQPIAVLRVEPSTPTPQPSPQSSAHTAEPTLAVNPTLALPQAASLITPTISANQPFSTSPLSNDSQHVKVTNHITGSTATVATATGSLTETISADMSTVTATLATASATDNLTPTRQPTSTAIATSGAGSVKRAKNDTTPTPTRTPTPPTAMLGAVQLDTPADNATLEKEITFRWSLSQRAPPEVSQIFTPTSAYLFELIVFSDPKHPEEGRALVQASKTPSATVNVDLLQNSPWQFIEGREYYWSVRLGKTVNNHYQALALLATPRRFVFRPTTNK